MSLTSAAIRLMGALGLTVDQIADVADANAAPTADTAAEKRRAYDRERKRKSTGIPPEDNSALSTGIPPESSPPRTGAQVVTSSLPSLRSEELKNPPEKPTVSTPKGANARGSRLPDNWRPMPFVVEAGGQALNGDDWGAELDKFRDYWRAVPGAKGLKLDWDATWRNWLRRAAENSTRKAPHERPHRDPKFEARQANLAAAFRGADSAARRHRES